jgi:hypothetical protein
LGFDLCERSVDRICGSSGREPHLDGKLDRPCSSLSAKA